MRHLSRIAPDRVPIHFDHGGATIYPDSSLFSSAYFTLHSANATTAGPIAAAQFIVRPQALTLRDLETVFGSWYRSPPFPVPCDFALACFDGQQRRTRSPYALFAEFAMDGDQLRLDQSPERVFFQLRDW